jgi:hypothetical protein
MGYDHFALLAVKSSLNEKEIENLEKICKEMKNQDFTNGDEETLFGKVHHLCSGSFSEDYWWKAFDQCLLEIHKKSGVESFYLYTCEFNGECLQRYEYVKGKRTTDIGLGVEINNDINDNAVSSMWNISSLYVSNNITMFYNKKYPFEFTGIDVDDESCSNKSQPPSISIPHEERKDKKRKSDSIIKNTSIFVNSNNGSLLAIIDVAQIVSIKKYQEREENYEILFKNGVTQHFNLDGDSEYELKEYLLNQREQKFTEKNKKYRKFLKRHKHEQNSLNSK